MFFKKKEYFSMKSLFNIIIIIIFNTINTKNAIKKKLYRIIIFFLNVIHNINLIKNRFLVF